MQYLHRIESHYETTALFGIGDQKKYLGYLKSLKKIDYALDKELNDAKIKKLQGEKAKVVTLINKLPQKYRDKFKKLTEEQAKVAKKNKESRDKAREEYLERAREKERLEYRKMLEEKERKNKKKDDTYKRYDYEDKDKFKIEDKEPYWKNL